MMQHYVLLQRNLVYTGVTRGKKLVVLVGESRALHMAVKKQQDAQALYAPGLAAGAAGLGARSNVFVATY